MASPRSLALVLACLLVGPLLAQDAGRGAACDERWFGPTPGEDVLDPDHPIVFAEFLDLGSGPELYVGGPVRRLGSRPINGIARYVDGDFEPLLGDVDRDILVRDAIAFDDGSGLALYARGAFPPVGGGPVVGSIARWTGTDWDPLMAGDSDSVVGPLCVFDDGTGPTIYTLGRFETFGGELVEGLIRYDAGDWEQVIPGTFGDGPGSPFGLPTEIAVFDDGSGPAIYFGASFRLEYTPPAQATQFLRGIVRWRGAGIEEFGVWNDYFTTFNSGEILSDLHVSNVGGVPALYACGTFESVNGADANGVVRWDGSNWQAVGPAIATGRPSSPSSVWVRTLADFDAGGGLALYAGGEFGIGGEPQNLVRFDGAAWSPVGEGTGGGSANGRVSVLASGELEPGTPELFLGGWFEVAGSEPAKFMARWDGASFAGFDVARTGLSASALDFTSFDDGSGDGARLYAAGEFAQAGSSFAAGVARLDGDRWTPVGPPVAFEDAGALVRSICVHDDGSGPALYAGGRFDSIGDAAVDNVARFDGTEWIPVGAGLPFPTRGVEAIASHDDGTGPALYAAGWFDVIGGDARDHVARFDGTSWEVVGLGVTGDPPGPQVGVVSTLVELDDGTGPALYAGGKFLEMGGTPGTWKIARWNGVAWEALGGGLAGVSSDAQLVVEDIVLYDDGSNGLRIVVAAKPGGGITMPGGGGGPEPPQVFAFSGGAWTPIHSNLETVSDVRGSSRLAVLPGHGSGPDRLFLAGVGSEANGPAQRFVAELDPATGMWSTVEDGPAGAVDALIALDDGAGFGPVLFAGGSFPSTGDDGPAHVARFGGCGRGRIETTECGPAVPNASGRSGRIHGEGTVRLAENDLTLVASRIPANVFGIFLSGTGPDLVPMGGGIGTLCLGGERNRFVGPGQIQSSGALGFMTLPVDLTRLPDGAGVRAASVGETLRFQAWFRDASMGQGTSNLTNALRVTFE